MAEDFLSKNHIVVIQAAVADVGAQTMQGICMRDYNRCTFLISAGGTSADTSTVTLNANTTSAVSGGTAIAFKYRTCAFAASPATADTWGALTDATSAGIALTATTYKAWALEVTAADLEAGAAESDFVYPALADAGGATTGTIIAILSEPRYTGSAPHTAIA